MDEIRIWNTALNQSTIQSWRNRPVNNSHPFISNLKCYFDFNFTTNPLSVISDLSNSGNNGYVINGAQSILSTAPLDGTFGFNWNPAADFQNNAVQNTIVTPSASGLNSYTVIATAPNGCTSSASTSVYTLTSPSTPVITSSVNPAVFCNSGSGTLSLQNPSTGATIQWQSSGDNMIWSDINGANGNTYVTGNVTTTTYFRVKETCSAVDTSNVIQFQITQPVITSVSDATRCGLGMVTLSVSGTGTFDWYQNSTGGASLATGPVFNPFVTSSVTYWIESHIGNCFYSGGRQPVTVTVTPAPVVNVSASLTTICQGQSTTLSASSGNDPDYVYTWTPGNLSGNSVQVNPAATLTYTVNAIDNSSGANQGCAAINTIVITVNPAPATPIISPALPAICSPGQSVILSVSNTVGGATYAWSNGQTGTSISVSPNATTVYSINASFATGCTSAATTTVTYDTVSSPAISANGPTTFCAGGNVVLDAGTGYTSYIWSDGNNVVGNSQTLNASPLSTTIYTVTVGRGGSCTASATQQVTIGALQPPVISTANSATSFCSGDSLYMIASSGYSTYSWSDVLGTIGSNQDINVNNGGTFTVTVTSGNGCSATASIIVTKNPSPQPAVISYSGLLSLCDDDSNSPLTLTADTTGVGQGITLTWNNFDETSGTTQLPVYGSNLDFLIFSNPYPFQLITTNSFGCRAFSNSVSVSSVTCPSAISLNLILFIEGFVDPSTGMMDNGGAGGCLSIVGIPGATTTDADTVHVSLMNASSHILEATADGILQTNGSLSVTFQSGVTAGNYFIRITHRNALETWSSNAVSFAAGSNTYDFSNAANKAYGNNMIEVYPGKWAIYSGDISDANYLGLGLGYQDGVVEAQDYLDEENAIAIIQTGYQFADITGDGIAESFDYLVMENAVAAIRFAVRP